MQPPYRFEILKKDAGPSVVLMLELFAGRFGQVNIDEDGDTTFTTPNRAIAVNIAQVLVADDVSFEYKAGE